jgi:phage shock protein PspC (stress-responsive transcriptional regulator)
MKKKILYRSKWGPISGVCTGFADYFDIDVSYVVWGWILASILTLGLGIIAYLICWKIIPKEE